MVTPDRVEVILDNRVVGTLAHYGRYQTAFEYSAEWIQDGYSISPFSLPLERGVKIANITPFDGMFGIFEDSLPDGWGRLLVDRMLRREGEDPDAVDALSRLTTVGSSGLGALEYRPVYKRTEDVKAGNLDHIADECAKILRSEESDDLDMLLALGGSSGGARPKIMLDLDGEDWIVKFPSSADPKNIGLMEYEYTECARACGIEVSETRLLHSDNCSGYFACRRFDRITHPDGLKTGEKLHMASASALLEVSHRMPSLDYTSLMSLAWQLTKKTNEVEKMYRLMCFNVYAHNRDDHSNNFTFLCDKGEWRLSPAYDLTYSNSIGGEHATTIAGEGKNPTIKDILEVAKRCGINERKAKEIAKEIEETVRTRLNQYVNYPPLVEAGACDCPAVRGFCLLHL